jgi:hypothetical protein
LIDLEAAALAANGVATLDQDLIPTEARDILDQDAPVIGRVEPIGDRGQPDSSPSLWPLGRVRADRQRHALASVIAWRSSSVSGARSVIGVSFACLCYPNPWVPRPENQPLADRLLERGVFVREMKELDGKPLAAFKPSPGFRAAAATRAAAFGSGASMN